MADAISQQVLDSMATVLRGILIANGYQTDIGNNVFQDRSDNEALDFESEMPGIILRDPEEKEEGDAIGSTILTMTVHILAFSTGAMAVKDIRNKILPDIRKCIKANRSWGTSVIQTRIVGRTIDFIRDEHIIANGTVLVEVDYQESWS